MDLQKQQHESRQGKLPTQPRLGQAVTYWRVKQEVSPDEELRTEVKTLSAKVSILVVFRVIE